MPWNYCTSCLSKEVSHTNNRGKLTKKGPLTIINECKTDKGIIVCEVPGWHIIFKREIAEIERGLRSWCREDAFMLWLIGREGDIMLPNVQRTHEHRDDKIADFYLSRSTETSQWSGQRQVCSHWQLPWPHSSETHKNTHKQFYNILSLNHNPFKSIKQAYIAAKQLFKKAYSPHQTQWVPRPYQHHLEQSQRCSLLDWMQWELQGQYVIKVNVQ